MKRTAAYLEEAAKQAQEPPRPLRKAVERAMELVQAVEGLMLEPSKAGLTSLGQELIKIRGKGQVLILNQGPSLAAEAHELITKVEEVISKGQ
jgi:hypothetical protein